MLRSVLVLLIVVTLISTVDLNAQSVNDHFYGKFFRTAQSDFIHFMPWSNRSNGFKRFGIVMSDPNDSTYNHGQIIADTWGFEPADAIVVPQKQIESLIVAGNVMLRPGTVLVRDEHDLTTTYAVGRRGFMYEVPPDSIDFFYGKNWKNNLVIHPTSVFPPIELNIPNYYKVAPKTDKFSYPDQTLIRYESMPEKIFFIYGGQKHFVTPQGFKRNIFKEKFIVTVPEEIQYPDGGIIDRCYTYLLDLSQYSAAENIDYTTGIKKAENNLPKNFELQQNYPNPFNPSTTIEYSLEKDSKVNLIIYNTAGQFVAELINHQQIAGLYKVIWNATGLPSGTYLCRLSIEQQTEIRKMIFIK